MGRFALLIAVFTLLVSSGYGQTSETVLRELLDLPSPPPLRKPEGDNENNVRQHPSEFYDADHVPSDNAPIEDVLDYWAAHQGNELRVSDHNAGRLMAEIDKKPETLTSFLKILQTNEATGKMVEKIFDESLNSDLINESSRKTIRDWLRLNTKKFVDELAADAARARDQASYGSVIKSDDLSAYARLDPEAAKPILDRFAQDRTNPRTATLALSLLYKNAVLVKDTKRIEDLRNDLKKIVTDRTAPGFARDAASDALFASTWADQDDWYLSLFEDGSLLEATDGNSLYSPISTLASKDPKKWVPVLIRLLESRDMSVRNSAVKSLMEIESKESIQPLIPWLSDPDWAQINWSPGGRSTLIQIVTKFDLRESIPGLIWIVENEDDEVEWAARSLGEFRDPRAVPALKNALQRIKGGANRDTIITALLACGGLTSEEQMESLEAYARFSLKPDEMTKLRDSKDYDDTIRVPVSISIGSYLSFNVKKPSEGLIRAVIARQKILQKKEPSIAKALSEIMAKWQGRLIDLELLDRIDKGSADTESIIGALARRKQLREILPMNFIYCGEKPAVRGASHPV